MALNQPTTSANYVLKVYNTEAKADRGKDTEALLVVSSSDPTIDNSTKINDTYTINRKYYYLFRNLLIFYIYLNPIRLLNYFNLFIFCF